MEVASIRCKNPGAMWGRVGKKPTEFYSTPQGPRGCATNAPIPVKWHSKNTIYLADGLGQNNNIAIFDNWVDGICAQLDLWRTSANYHNKTLADAIAVWSGHNNVESYLRYILLKVPGITRGTVMDDGFWRSSMGVEFLKAQAGHEAGQPYPAPDADFETAQHRVMNTGEVPVPTMGEEVAMFQRQHSLKPDGIIGPATWAAIKEVMK